MTTNIQHPAALMDFSTLQNGLEACVKAGTVKRFTAPDNPALVGYCYTEKCVFDRLWNEFSMLARGIVLDTEARCVRACPFPKFFNYGEWAQGTTKIPEGSFEVFEKLDGSLGIVYHDGKRWRVNTKASFDNEQSRWALAWLQAHVPQDKLLPGDTYLFEIIYDANRIVIRYPYEGLVLLSYYDKHGVEGTDRDDVSLAELALVLGVRLAKRYPCETFMDAVKTVEGFGADKEGFVVRFASGLRLKLKGAEYLRVHKFISRVTPLAIWDLLANGQDPMPLRAEVPDEFSGDFDTIHALLNRAHDEVVEELSAALEWCKDRTDKELGLSTDLTDRVRRFIFIARRNPAGWHTIPRNRMNIFRSFRPDGNNLPGYAPSASLNRAQDGDA